MEIKRGIPVSPGVAIGPALVVDTEGYRIPQRFIDPAQRNREADRFRAALTTAAAEAREKQETIDQKLGKQYGAIFAAHALLIEDPELIREVETLIREQRHSAEYAVSQVIRRHVKAWESVMAARNSADLFDIEKVILGHLLGSKSEKLTQLTEPVIVLAHDLTPSETASLDPKLVFAFATEAGGRASHTAIMAGVLEIPAVVGLGRFLNDLSGADEVIVDGNRGVLIINPDDETRAHYEETRQNIGTFFLELRELRDLPAVTDNGQGERVTLMGNIEFPPEVEHCLERGADGIGLYRTEFLYLNKTTDPDEAEHVEAYMTVLRTLGSRPVVIRTLDLGADKFTQRVDPRHQERNPFLGLRSVRLCLRNLTLFKTQLRAILRASAYGDVRIMFPMISTLLEMRQCKMILAEVKEDLEEEGIAFNRKMPVGTMIEVPSAAIMAKELAREVDFFSIGTNDLIQYTLAADRTNETVAGLYSAGDPAVLRLIEGVIKAAQSGSSDAGTHNGGTGRKVDVSVCGEMSGDPIYTVLLVGMGLRQLSVTPQNIPEIKKIIRTVTLHEAKEVAEAALKLDTARDVNNYLRERTRRILPEVVS